MPTMLLGDWTAHTLEAGALWLDGGAMFGSVPKGLWSRTNPPDERNRIRLAMRTLLLEGLGRRILVDTGLGAKSDARFRELFRVEDEPTLEQSLAEHGLAPRDITDVILTHLHFDHAGGATKREADKLSPTFPAARHLVQRRNWENALAPNPRERASYLRENFEPLAESGVVEWTEGASEPWPGVQLFLADGHTRGQQLVRVQGGGETLYFVADLIPTAAHVRIPFVMGYDMAAIETMAEKRTLLERAVAEGAWICIEHDPDTAFARPAANGDDFTWSERIPGALPALVDRS